MALSPVVCSPCWDHVHSPAGLMLVSATPLIEFPPAPPLAMSHSSKSTLLLKKKTKNSGRKQEVVTATKKYLTAFQHQINLWRAPNVCGRWMKSPLSLKSNDSLW